MKNLKPAEIETQQKINDMTNRTIVTRYNQLISRRNYLHLIGEMVPNSLLRSIYKCREALGIPCRAILVAILMMLCLFDLDAQQSQQSPKGLWGKYTQGYWKRAEQKFRATSEIFIANSDAKMSVNLKNSPLVAEKYSLDGFEFQADIPVIGSKTISFAGVEIDLDKEITFQMRKSDIYFRNGFSFPFGYVTYSTYKGLLASQNPLTEHFTQGEIFNGKNIGRTLSRLVTQSPNDKSWQVELGFRPLDVLLMMHEPRLYFGKKSHWWIGGDVTYAMVFGKEGTYRATFTNLGIDIRTGSREFLQDQGFDIPFTNERVGLSESLVETGVELAAGYLENRLLDDLFIFGDPLLKGHKWSLLAELGWKGISFRYRYAQERKRNFLTAAAINEIGGDALDIQPGPMLTTTYHEFGVVIDVRYTRKNKVQSSLLESQQESSYEETVKLSPKDQKKAKKKKRKAQKKAKKKRTKARKKKKNPRTITWLIRGNNTQ